MVYQKIIFTRSPRFEKKFSKLAEGVSIICALMVLSKRYDSDLPICEAVYSIINKAQEPKRVLRELFLRPMKSEF